MSNLTKAAALICLSAPAVAQTWTNTHPTASGWTIRYAAAAAESAGENQIFQFGGVDGLSSSSAVWRFHRTDGWFVMGNMPAGRHDSAATRVEVGGQDYIHLLGGGVGGTSTSTTNWRYDPNADSWDTAGPAPMPVAKANMEAVTAPDGLVYVFGGNNASGSVVHSSMHIYDPVANSWSAGPTMPRARSRFAAIKDCDGYIYLYGGHGSTGSPIAEIDCFDTVSGVWLATNPHGGVFPPMLTPRTDVAGALGRNGRHYLIGGNVASPVAVPTVEAFNPYTNTWTTEASLTESRNAHRVIGLGSRIWVLGGYRKIWPTTNQLESYGALGAYGPCSDDVGTLPPPSYGFDFATAVPLDFVTSFTGGIIQPGQSHYFTVRLRPHITTFVDIVEAASQPGMMVSVFDENLQLVSEGPARDGVLLNPEGTIQASYSLVLTRGQGGGIGSSAYDLHCTSTNDPRPIGEVYCTTAVPNSTGDPSSIRATGLESAAANSVKLEVAGLPAQTFGFFLVSPQAGTIVSPGNSQGVLCLTGFNIGRYNASILNSGANGEVQLAIDTRNVPLNPVHAIQPGDTLYFSYWHRDVDSMGLPTSNFSDGICIDFR